MLTYDFPVVPVSPSGTSSVVEYCRQLLSTVTPVRHRKQLLTQAACYLTLCAPFSRQTGPARKLGPADIRKQRSLAAGVQDEYSSRQRHGSQTQLRVAVAQKHCARNKPTNRGAGATPLANTGRH